MLEFREALVSEASEDFLRFATLVVNRANAAKVRIFPGERLEPDGIVDDYAHTFLTLAYHGAAPVATMVTHAIPPALKVELVAVVPESQGQGLTRFILDRADHLAGRQGLDRLLIEAVDMGGLIPYYQRLGFVEEFRELRPIGYWGASIPFDLVTMSRRVG